MKHLLIHQWPCYTYKVISMKHSTYISNAYHLSLIKALTVKVFDKYQDAQKAAELLNLAAKN
jgi:hypothetical protein